MAYFQKSVIICPKTMFSPQNKGPIPIKWQNHSVLNALAKRYDDQILIHFLKVCLSKDKIFPEICENLYKSYVFSPKQRFYS